jgi:hypothetical protein
MGCSGLNALYGLELFVESRRSGGSDETIDKIRLSQSVQGTVRAPA